MNVVHVYVLNLHHKVAKILAVAPCIHKTGTANRTRKTRKLLQSNNAVLGNPFRKLADRSTRANRNRNWAAFLSLLKIFKLKRHWLTGNHAKTAQLCRRNNNLPNALVLYNNIAAAAKNKNWSLNLLKHHKRRNQRKHILWLYKNKGWASNLHGGISKITYIHNLHYISKKNKCELPAPIFK